MLYDAAYMKFVFPARRLELNGSQAGSQSVAPFSLYGPTCDSADFMPGPFYLPEATAEGDYIEIGNIGAYGRAMSSRFNGFGHYDEAVLQDEPMLTMYSTADLVSGAAYSG